MNPQLCFILVFLVLAGLMVFLDRKYCMLRDTSTAAIKPYSLSRVQLAWWTLIVLASFMAILILKCEAANMDRSQIILLGISSVTTLSARMIDVSDSRNPKVLFRSQDSNSDNFILDILSDESGVSIHRFQAVVFNLVFGIWFIVKVFHNLDITSDPSLIMPVLNDNNLLLIGLSSGTYAALKATENKGTTPPEKNPAASTVTNTPPPVS